MIKSGSTTVKMLGLLMTLKQVDYLVKQINKSYEMYKNEKKNLLPVWLL